MQEHGASRQLTKLKIAVQLQDLFDTTRAPVPRSRPGHGNDSEAGEWSVLKMVKELKAVLEEVSQFMLFCSSCDPHIF